MPAIKKKPAAAGRTERRSPCPVACSLDILGDRWTLLIIRDLVLGHGRFRDLAASPEGMPTNILSDRLERLLLHGIIEQTPAPDGTKRSAYRLTKKGRALLPVLKAVRDWGLKWIKSTRTLPAITHAQSSSYEEAVMEFTFDT